MSGVDEHAEAHRLKTELGYGARRIGKELGISRYAAEQLLARPLAQPVAEASRLVAEPVAEVADQERPVAARVASHLDALVGQAPATPRRLVVDLDDFPGLAEDLALLEETGAAAADVVSFAIDHLAAVYRTALAIGRLRPGEAFVVVAIDLRPAADFRQAA